MRAPRCVRTGSVGHVIGEGTHTHTPDFGMFIGSLDEGLELEGLALELFPRLFDTVVRIVDHACHRPSISNRVMYSSASRCIHAP